VTSPAVIGRSVGSLVDPLEKTIFKKLKANRDAEKNENSSTTNTDGDRDGEFIRSALRLAIVVDGVEDVSANRRWVEFMEKLRKKDQLVTVFEALKQEKGALVF